MNKVNEYTFLQFSINVPEGCIYWLFISFAQYILGEFLLFFNIQYK